jgi:hypothetical protein
MFVSHLRLTLTSGIVAGLMAFGAPAAIADQPITTDGSVHVCNQATPTSLGGSYVAYDAATGSPAARYTGDLQAKPGGGGGLVRAAANSPALTLCGEPAGGDVLFLT